MMMGNGHPSSRPADNLLRSDLMFVCSQGVFGNVVIEEDLGGDLIGAYDIYFGRHLLNSESGDVDPNHSQENDNASRLSSE